MVLIGQGEGLPYEEFKRALVLALLHDIGNALAEKHKIKSSEIKEARDIGDMKKTMELAKGSIDFRVEHMEKGPSLVREITGQYVEKGLLSKSDVDLICLAVEKHDNPSIEKVSEDLRKDPDGSIDLGYKQGQFLLSLDGSLLSRLILLLREADRFFMVTYQGVLKDVMEDVKGNKSRVTPERIWPNSPLMPEAIRRSTGFIKKRVKMTVNSKANRSTDQIQATICFWKH